MTNLLAMSTPSTQTMALKHHTQNKHKAQNKHFLLKETRASWRNG